MLSQTDYERMQTLLENAKLFFKLGFGLTATRPEISYLDVFHLGNTLLFTTS